MSTPMHLSETPPQLPPEIFYNIADRLYDDVTSLRNLALVSRGLVKPAQSQLFDRISIGARSQERFGRLIHAHPRQPIPRRICFSSGYHGPACHRGHEPAARISPQSTGYHIAAARVQHYGGYLSFMRRSSLPLLPDVLQRGSEGQALNSKQYCEGSATAAVPRGEAWRP